MKNALTAIFARLHDAGSRMRIAPAFKDGDAAAVSLQPEDGEIVSEEATGGNGPVEAVEGSTARAVAATVDMFSAELLDAARQLAKLQAQLDEQEEGCAPVATLSTVDTRRRFCPCSHLKQLLETCPSHRCVALRAATPAEARARARRLRVRVCHMHVITTEPQRLRRLGQLGEPRCTLEQHLGHQPRCDTSSHQLWQACAGR